MDKLRVLVFVAGKDEKIYARCHDAIRFGRNQKQDPPGMPILKQERRIKRTLESIGVLDPILGMDLQCTRCGHVLRKGDPLSRALQPEGGTVTLEDGDVTFLMEYLAKIPWTGDIGDSAADAHDYLFKITSAELEKADALKTATASE